MKLRLVFAFLFSLFLLVPGVFSQDPELQPVQEPEMVLEDGMKWFNTASWDMGGRGWDEGLVQPYYRFPEKAQQTIPGSVWYLSTHSAGLYVRFKTDATKIFARHQLRHALNSMPHMTAVGASGLDLYNREEDGKWYWAGFSKPVEQDKERPHYYQLPLLEGASKKEREYMLYLPLYNMTESLWIGVPEEFELEPLPREQGKPIVYYGTSITHGCSASRPGMVFTSMLGRRLAKPMINLGFSGNGRMELEMAELIAEIDAEVFVIDCIPNMTHPMILERAEAHIRKYRELRPEVPIVLVEDRTLSNARLLPWWTENHAKKRVAMREIFAKLTDEGMSDLYYIRGEHLLGDDEEGTIDSSHPNDLGMQRMADSVEPTLREILEKH